MFFAIGFETTAPSTALTLMRAKAEGIRNFSVFCNHVTIIPGDPRDSRFARHAARRLHRPRTCLDRDRLPPLRVDCHDTKANRSWFPGFEPLDMLQSIVMLLRQLKKGEARVENQYRRVVPWEGNRAALRAMAEVFQLRPYFEWRGLGFISQSALRLQRQVCGVGCGAALRGPGRARDRSQSRAMRRSAERRAEAAPVQTLWP